MNAQRESRDADIFRRVVDRIKVCVEEATAPATAAATATAAPDGSTASRPGSPTQLPPAAPADLGNKKKKMRKREKGSGAGAGDGPVGASEAQCNWALAHAACRVCRVVGRTFQVAIRCVLVRRLRGG